MGVEIHPTAIVAKGAELADGVSVGPYTLIGEHVKIGPRTQTLAITLCRQKKGATGHAATVRNDSNLL